MIEVCFVFYYCEKCLGYVLPKRGIFEHPDIGPATCWICPTHNCMVDVTVDVKEME